MIRKYVSRICFGPDDVIGGGSSEDEIDVSSDISELFNELSGGASKDAGGEGDKPPAEGDIPGDDPGDGDGGEGEGEEEPEGGEPPDDNPSPNEGTGEQPADPTVTALEAKIASLTQMIESMSSKINPAPVKEEPAKVKAPELDLQALFKDVDFEKVMESKENFITFLGQAMAAQQENTVNTVMSSVPNVVTGYIAKSNNMKAVADNFYAKYPELATVKSYVSNVANQVTAEHTDWDVGKVLEEAAKLSKEALGITTVAKPTEKSKSKKPTLPGNKGTRQKPGKVSKMQSEIDDILND